MGHLYKVELIRRVRQPLYGRYATSIDVKRKEFHFGKGKEFRTGRDAFSAASEFAMSMLENSSSVSIWKINGNTGNGQYLKDDKELLFNNGWD